MQAIFVIAAREWRALFLSPLAWTLLAVLFAISAYMFNATLRNYQIQQVQFQMYGGASGGMSLTDWTISPTLGNAAVLLLLLMPLITMRIIAEEKRRDTWPALAASPLLPMQIVLGKYLGLLMFIGVTVGLLALLPLAVLPYGNPDLGQVAAALLGLFLVAAAFAAVGLAASSATDNPTIAAVSSFGVLLMLWIASWLGSGGEQGVDGVLGYISLLDHYDKFLRGVISSADLAYFLIIIALGLLFARQRLLAERIRG